MKKNIKKLTAVILMMLMVFSISGCAILDSKLNDIKGDLIGNSYTIRTYDNYGSIVMTATGDRINIVGNPVETTSYSSDESLLDTNYHQLLRLISTVSRFRAVVIHVYLKEMDYSLMQYSVKMIFTVMQTVLPIGLVLLVSLINTKTCLVKVVLW